MEKQPDWKDRFNDIVQTCQDEIKKTTEIGKKMLTASKANTQMNESYEELGHLAFKAIEKGELTWDHMRVQELISKIKTCEQDLESIEKDVSEIKKMP